MVKRIAGILFGVLLFNGCYTQFSTLEEKREAPPQPQISYEIDSATGDTMKVVRSVDTIAGAAAQRQNCYWTRNFWGEAELKCDNSTYGHDWYVYNDYPWWYRSEPYYYDSYGRCPRYYYYDASCGCCQYWGGGGFRDNYGSGNRGSSISGTGSGGKVRRTTSFGGTSSKSVQQQPSGAAKTTESVERQRRQATNAASSAVDEALKNTAPATVVQQPQSAPRETNQPAAPAVAPAPSSPEGNSPPPSSSGGSNGNDRNRRNPRSW